MLEGAPPPRVPPPGFIGPPLGIVLIRHHRLLLYRGGVAAVSRLSGAVVGVALPPSGVGPLLGMARQLNQNPKQNPKQNPNQKAGAGAPDLPKPNDAPMDVSGREDASDGSAVEEAEEEADEEGDAAAQATAAAEAKAEAEVEAEVEAEAESGGGGSCGVVWVWSADALLPLSVRRESRHLWRMHLAAGDYARALAFSTGSDEHQAEVRHAQVGSPCSQARTTLLSPAKSCRPAAAPFTWPPTPTPPQAPSVMHTPLRPSLVPAPNTLLPPSPPFSPPPLRPSTTFPAAPSPAPPSASPAPPRPWRRWPSGCSPPANRRRYAPTCSRGSGGPNHATPRRWVGLS